MASPAGYVAVVYGGVEFAPSSLDWVLWITKGLNEVPLVRGTDDVVPRARGRTRRARVADTRAIEVEGWVLGHGTTLADTIENFRASVQSLQALFDPEADPQALEATLEDGTVVTIDASTVPPIVIEEVVASHVARVSVALEAVAPDWEPASS